jgi:hypothetical protein
MHPLITAYIVASTFVLGCATYACAKDKMIAGACAGTALVVWGVFALFGG